MKEDDALGNLPVWPSTLNSLHFLKVLCYYSVDLLCFMEQVSTAQPLRSQRSQFRNEVIISRSFASGKEPNEESGGDTNSKKTTSPSSKKGKSAPDSEKESLDTENRYICSYSTDCVFAVSGEVFNLVFCEKIAYSVSESKCLQDHTSSV